MVNGQYAYFNSNRNRGICVPTQLNQLGYWNSALSYVASESDAVSFANGTYLCLADNVNFSPGAVVPKGQPLRWSPLILISAMGAEPISVALVSGNTTGTTASIYGTLLLAGGSNITLKQESNSITVLGSLGVAVSAGNNTQGTGTVIFSNSNGVSFGLDTNGALTASYTTPSTAGLLSAVNISAGTTSNNLSAITFSNSNGVSFGLNSNSVITASVGTNYQSPGAYLTTAMLSNAATISNINVSASNTSANLSNLVFSNSNGVSFGLSGNTLTASALGGGGGGAAISAGTNSRNSGTVAFANSNGISFGLDTNGSLTATVATNYQTPGAYLTTADLSQNSSKYAGINASMTGGSLTVNTSGVSINLPAYLTTAMLSNAATLSNVNVSAGTTSTNASAFTFANSNGVTFGLGTGASAGSITASVVTTYLTTAALSQNTSNYAGINSAITGGSLTVNTSGVSINLPAYLTTAMQSASSSVFAKTGFTSTTTGGTAIVATHDTNGLSMGVPAMLTTAMLSNAATISNINVSAGTTSSNLSAVTFANSNGVTFGLGTGASAGIITASASGAGAGGAAISANTNSQNTGTVNFSNSNGVSFGLNTNGVLTASVVTTYLTTAALSQNTSNYAGINSAITGGSLTVNTSGISINLPAYLTTAALSQNTSNYAGINSAITGGSLTVNTSGVSINLPAYITTAAQSSQTLAISLSGNTATTNSSQIINGGYALAGGNNVTLQQSNNTISISVGNYITTADLSQNSSKYAGINSAITGGSLTVNTSGVSINLPAYLTTAALSQNTSNYAGINSAITGGSLTVNTSGVSINLPAYLTTAALSQNTSNYAGINSAITGGSLTVNTSGVSINLPAYLTTAAQSTQTLQFTLGGNVATTNSSQAANGGFILAGGNNLTIQQSNNSISFSVGNYITTADLSQNSSKYAGINSAITGGSLTVNTSGVSINLPAYLTTAALSQNTSNYAGINSAITGGSLTVNTSGVSINLPAYLTTAALSQNTSNYAGINSAITGGSLTVNTSGVSINLPAYLTTAALSSQTLAISLSGNTATTNSSQILNGGYALAGGNNVTLQQSNNTISISVGNYITTAALSQNTSNYAGINSAITGGSLTVNTSGVSINLPAYLTTAMQSASSSVFARTGFTSTTTGGTAVVGTHDTNGLSLGVPAYITTAMLSNAATISNINLSAGTTSTNASAYTFSNANGISFGIGTGANAGIVTGSIATSLSVVNFSVAGSSANLGSVVFSNSGGVSFGLAGSTITATVATNYDLAANTTNYLQAWELDGANTAGTTSSVQGTKLYLSAGPGLTLSGSSNTIVISNPYCGWYEPYQMSNTALFGPVAGSWYFAPFIAQEFMSGGRINLLHQNTSTAGLFMDITGASYHSGSTGTLSQVYTYSKVVALYSQGAGTNSTQLQSIWSNSFSFGWSKVIQVSLSQASNINISVAHSLSYISEIGSNGAYTLNQYANSTATSVANSTTSSGQYSGVATSIRNMLSNSIIEPIGFNTTIPPGAYWLAFAWSTTRGTSTTGGLLASALDFSVSSEVGISRLVLESAYRNWGSTVTTARSHIMPYGVYTGAANMAPPSVVNLSSDLSSLASAWVPYFNFQLQGITK